MKKNCVICGTEFEAKGKAVACSNKCTFINRRQKASLCHNKEREEVRNYRLIASTPFECPWASGRLSEEITCNQVGA